MIKYLLILGVILLAWCPWFKADEAITIIDARIMELQDKNPNLCPTFAHKETIKKVAFGYAEKVSYDCTTTDDLYGILKSTDTVLITFYKGILGMPSKRLIERY